jgi:hypothetical protein
MKKRPKPELRLSASFLQPADPDAIKAETAEGIVPES